MSSLCTELQALLAVEEEEEEVREKEEEEEEEVGPLSHVA